MDMNLRTAEQDTEPLARISYHSLDYLRQGEQYYYIWRQHPPQLEQLGAFSLLLDLNGLLMPAAEVEMLIRRLDGHIGSIQAIAFINCHISNQREIKRRLKACDVRLFSRSAFFTDLPRAKQWLLDHALG